MTTLIENRHSGGFLVSEANGKRSREEIKLASGAGVCKTGLVLGKISAGAATSAVKASGANTGTGTFVIDATTPTLDGARPGIYTLRCIEAVADGGKFELNDPSGALLGIYIIPAGAGNSIAIAEQIKGVLSDGGTNFIVGDGFDITVPAGTGEYKAYDPTALNGTQVAAAVLWGDGRDSIDATSAAKPATGILRDAEVNVSELNWGAGVTTGDHKTAALTALAKLGIVGR